jgi:hypothetical protein
MRKSYDRITTTIKREWLAEIITGTKKIEYRRIKPLLDGALRESLDAIRTAPAERDESSSPRSDGFDPQNHQGQTRWRLRVAHQEGSGIQTLGQAAADTQTVSSATPAGFFLKAP